MAWNAAKNDAYRIKVYNWSVQLRQLGFSAFEIVQTAQAENVLAGEVLQDGNSVSAAEVAAMVGVAGDLIKFLQDMPVSTGDREADLARILAGPME
jgi:hypothetical protein